MKSLEISYEELRSVVLEVLRGGGVDQIASLRTAVAAKALQLSLVPNHSMSPGAFNREENLSGADYGRVISIFWDLIVEGIVRPGLNEGMNNNLPFFHVTAWGKRVLSEGTHTPYDPDGYLARLAAELPRLDPIIVTYLNESLHTLRIGCLLSSTIALGVAAEKALLLLIEA